MPEGKNIGIIGAGNVGCHLALSFSSNPENQISLFSRTPPHRSGLVEVPNIHLADDIHDLSESLDFLFLCVQDHAIPELAGSLPPTNAIVLHTSGSTSLEILREANLKRNGVFYPLQSFSAKTNLDYRNIPVLIESGDENVAKELHMLASAYFGEVRFLIGQERMKMHLAAVIVNNFVNHLYSQSYRFLQKENLDFSLLLPLIRETANRLNNQDPASLQTGPAKRGDRPVIEKHMELLQHDTELKTLYTMLTRSIEQFHGKP